MQEDYQNAAKQLESAVDDAIIELQEQFLAKDINH